MDLGLRGRVALVAASSQGIGFACAEALAGEGAHLVICSRDRQRIEQAGDHLRSRHGVEVEPVVADLAVAEGPALVAAAARERFGQIDVLVTNAGGPPALPFLELGDEHWQRAFDGLVMSVQRLVRACLPGMVAAGWGRVIAITSCACREPEPGLLLSNSVRVGIHGLLRSLVQEYGGSGVTFNAVLPGYTLTERLAELLKVRSRRRGEAPETALQELEKTIPAGRAGRPEEIAAAVLFLASRQASYISGIGLQVDGGRGRFLP